MSLHLMPGPEHSSKRDWYFVRHSAMNSFALRIPFLILLGALGAYTRPFGLPGSYSFLLGSGCGLLAALLERWVARVELKSLLGAFVGMFLGGGAGFLCAAALGDSLSGQQPAKVFVQAAVSLAGIYIGLVSGAAKSKFIKLGALGMESTGEPRNHEGEKILDTSVLIDGRIADIVESGFVEGRLAIPQFVLHELQLIADSADSARRNRGRRGLDVVQQLQKLPKVRVEVTVLDFPAVREVDLKLIEMAKLRRSKIVTNDFNLNKLAQVQGVQVLNINELANALKPIVLPGESMRVFILKEGKEHNQGVAYLDDGTMVVVDNAKRLISKTVDITVTSVLQTTAGKMIFGKYDERVSGEHRSGPMSVTASAGAS
jgi:uncharacterized protein YacL